LRAKNAAETIATCTRLMMDRALTSRQLVNFSIVFAATAPAPSVAML